VTTGELVRLSDVDGHPALLVLFLCRHCPYVKRVEHGIARLANDYEASGVAIVAISANDPETYPEDAAPSLAEQADEAGFRFPYLFDETQEVAKAYTAACTPDPFLFDAERRLVYRGQLDDARPSNDVAVTCEDVRAAIDAVLEGRPVPSDQRPAVGCSIKWRPGNEPD
jgi:peroxiredoxin